MFVEEQKPVISARDQISEKSTACVVLGDVVGFSLSSYMVHIYNYIRTLDLSQRLIFNTVCQVSFLIPCFFCQNKASMTNRTKIPHLHTNADVHVVPKTYILTPSTALIPGYLLFR